MATERHGKPRPPRLTDELDYLLRWIEKLRETEADSNVIDAAIRSLRQTRGLLEDLDRAMGW